MNATQRLYRTVWRWHFYAGLFVMPVLITLSISGSLYLFKPQIERWEERAFRDLPVSTTVSPSEQVEAAQRVYHEALFLDYRLPERSVDAAMVRLASSDGLTVQEVFVAPDGEVLGALMSTERIMMFVKRIHSELLIGKAGNWLVELAACWAIVLILSGLYLWWPRGRKAAGVIWPRFSQNGRLFWRDLHAVTGFWISGFVLVLLLTGLPWTGVWGSAFQTLRIEMGWVNGQSAWDIDGAEPQRAAGAHGHHGGAAHHHLEETSGFSAEAFNAVVAKAGAQSLPYPVIVTPPGLPGRFGAPGENLWMARSDAMAPLQQTLRFDLDGQQELSRESFRDGHIIDRVVGYGIAWHEGQLLGWANQLIGVMTALGLVMMVVTGFLMWLRRKPTGKLGAPAAETSSRLASKIVISLMILALVLPLLAISLIVVLSVERLIVWRLPKTSEWLGLTQ